MEEMNMARRDTSQQRAIRAAVHSAGRPLSVQEIHEIASQDCPNLGIRTVYRALNRPLDDDSIAPVVVPGQPDRYEPAAIAAKHHHHFRCEECDRVFDVDACPGGLNRMLPAGFKLTGHELSLWGTCSECA
jgi:Fur family ferric uptake transcriptional regulator